MTASIPASWITPVGTQWAAFVLVTRHGYLRFYLWRSHWMDRRKSSGLVPSVQLKVLRYDSRNQSQETINFSVETCRISQKLEKKNVFSSKRQEDRPKQETRTGSSSITTWTAPVRWTLRSPCLRLTSLDLLHPQWTGLVWAMEPLELLHRAQTASPSPFRAPRCAAT